MMRVRWAPAGAVLVGWLWVAPVLRAAPPAVDTVSFNRGEDVADRMTHPQVSDGDTHVETIGGRTARRHVNSSADRHFDVDTLSVLIPQPMSRVIGSTHASGKYFFDPSRDYLNEGAIEIANAGMRVIKLFFAPEDPDGNYRWNSSWPTSVASLKELAQHPYWREVFLRPFETYVLTIFEHRDFRKGFPDPGPAMLEQDFYDLARHLLETYNGTGKVFILGHHEGDWHLRGTTETSTATDPTPTNIQGMIRWYNARQAGVTRARGDVTATDVKVYAAAEVNLVRLAMQGRPTVTNDVLPYTNMDLVSYSAWDTLVPSDRRPAFLNALAYLAQKMPDRSTLDPRGVPFGDKNVFVAEYGYPAGASNDATQETVTEVAVEDGFAFGCPWIIYWEVFCNECCQPGDNPCKPRDGPLPADSNSLCRGFWLRRVDGTYSSAYAYLTSQIGSCLHPPTDFKVAIRSSRTVRLTWTDTSGEEQYRIERSANSGPYQLVLTPPANAVVGEDATGSPWNHYRYRIRPEKTGDEPPAWFYAEPVMPVLAGDLDHDGDVDQSDFGRFQACLTVYHEPVSAGCEEADLNSDTLIDATDLAVFIQCMSGPDQRSGC